MPKIVNDGKNLTLAFDGEIFALAGVAQLDDTHVFLTRDGKIFEIICEYLPLAGKTVEVAIFDVIAMHTPNGVPLKVSPFIPVVYDLAPTAEPQVAAPAEETAEEASVQEPEPTPEVQKEEIPPAEPEVAEQEAPTPEVEQTEPEVIPTVEQTEEPTAPAEPEVVLADSETETPKATVAERVARGEQVPLMDFIEENKTNPPAQPKKGKRNSRKAAAATA